MTNPLVEQLASKLSDQPDNPWRPEQTRGYQEERQRIADFVNSPPYIPGNRATATGRLRALDKMIADQAPRKIEEPMRANEVHGLAKEIIETVIKPGMLPRSHMRRNPAGALGHFQRVENSKPFKRAQRMVKRALWALDPDNTDPDHTNLEKYRAEGAGEATASFMPGAQIPGSFAMSPQAKANWPLGEPTDDTVLKQAKRGGSKTPEGLARQKSALAAGRAIQQAKRAAAKAAIPS